MNETTRPDGKVEGITLYNDSYVSGVYSWKEALEVLKEKGIEVVSACSQPIYDNKTNWATGITTREKIYEVNAPIYFFNNEKKEIASWSPINNAVVILKEPRIWWEGYLKDIEHKYIDTATNS